MSSARASRRSHAAAGRCHARRSRVWHCLLPVPRLAKGLNSWRAPKTHAFFRVVGGPGPLTPLLPYSILAHPSMTFVGVPPGPSPGLPHNMDEGGLASLPLVLVLFPVTCVAPFECRAKFLSKSPVYSMGKNRFCAGFPATNYRGSKRACPFALPSTPQTQRQYGSCRGVRGAEPPAKR